MKEFNAQAIEVETATALNTITQGRPKADYGAFIGLDVHKDTIAVAIAPAGREAPQYHGEIANTPKAVRKLVERLSRDFEGQLLQFCYEAGPCGYELHRQLLPVTGNGP